MNSENVFSFIIAFCICFFLATVGSCSYSINNSDNEAVKNLTSKGINAIDAMCAIRPTGRTVALCTVRAMKSN